MLLSMGSIVCGEVTRREDEVEGAERRQGSHVAYKHLRARLGQDVGGDGDSLQTLKREGVSHGRFRTLAAWSTPTMVEAGNLLRRMRAHAPTPTCGRALRASAGECDSMGTQIIQYDSMGTQIRAK